MGSLWRQPRRRIIGRKGESPVTYIQEHRFCGASRATFRTNRRLLGKVNSSRSVADSGRPGVRLDPLVHDHIPVAVFYPFVLVASIWRGTLAALSSLAISAAIGDLSLAAADREFQPYGFLGGHVDRFGIVCLFGMFIARLCRALA
jgi:hypothetical protein